MGQGLLIIEDSRSHSDTPHSVGLLWTSDQPVIYGRMWPNGTEGSSVDGAASVTSIYIYSHVRYIYGIASDKVLAIESNFVSYP